MKLPAKSRNLPSLARSLAGAGYATGFSYGGDLNFTDQASYMYATGWQQLTWQKDLRFDTPPADWGYDDAVMCDWFADRVIALSGKGEPFLAGMLTLSSHRPFDVPFSKFDDKELNAFAFSDECVGRMVDKLKASPAWDNLLLVLVADHGYPWPRSLSYNEPLRHRIPMIWLGGAVAAPRVVDTYASQIDICATILGQLGIDHSDFDYSKDIFAPTPPVNSRTIRSTTVSAWSMPRVRPCGTLRAARLSARRHPACWTSAARCSRRPMSTSETADSGINTWI